jgi:hypothetical protein
MHVVRSRLTWLTFTDTADTSKKTRALAPFRAYYRRPWSLLTLNLAALLLCYGGGAIMFWFHAYFRGERGPAINPWLHWMLDSTLGFIGLAPALLVLIPLAAYVAAAKGWKAWWVQGALVGVAFAFMTGPGPMVHDRLVGEHGPIGQWAVTTFGSDPGIVARNLRAHEHNQLLEGVYQVAFGLVVYVLLAWVALAVAPALTRLRSRAKVPAGAVYPADPMRLPMAASMELMD